MKVTQIRVDDHIDFYSATESGQVFLVAMLFDGHKDFVVDALGSIATLKITGDLPADFEVVMPMTVGEARLIDAMPVPDICN